MVQEGASKLEALLNQRIWNDVKVKKILLKIISKCKITKCMLGEICIYLSAGWSYLSVTGLRHREFCTLRDREYLYILYTVWYIVNNLTSSHMTNTGIFKLLWTKYDVDIICRYFCRQSCTTRTTVALITAVQEQNRLHCAFGCMASARISSPAVDWKKILPWCSYVFRP
jgi:hypothetical protein